MVGLHRKQNDEAILKGLASTMNFIYFYVPWVEQLYLFVPLQD